MRKSLNWQFCEGKPEQQSKLMPQQYKYICSCCGKEHHQWPALTFKAPDAYAVLSPEEKKKNTTINNDFCTIRHPQQTHRFIRCTLKQKVNEHCTNLEYGLWASLSEKSFKDYLKNYNNKNHETAYFGWLCNVIPEYTFKEHIPMVVYTKKGNQRPEIVPHEDFDHPFVRDYYNGISKQEAEKRINSMFESLAHTKTRGNKRTWWKFW